MVKPIRVLIVDDSPLMRKLIRSFFSEAQDIEVVGTAMNGRFALQKMPSLQPDVIILDLEMPEMNGLEFLKEKKKNFPEIPVIILSSVARRGAQVTMEAMAAGASDFFLKPAVENQAELKQIGLQIAELVRAYGAQKRKQTPNSEPASEKIALDLPSTLVAEALPQEREVIKRTPKRQPATIEVIAIGISTGGPNALRQIFPLLSKDLKIPLLVVQHMPAGFTKEFALSLDRICPLEVKEAEDGDLIRPGRILIAPGDRHLRVKQRPLARVIELDDSPPLNGHKPSVEILFASVAEVYQNHACALIMTGMGKDGAEAIGAVYEEGGLTLAQDADSSIVFGMPRAAIARGYIHRIVSLTEIPEVLNGLNNKQYLN